jgi:hypothetical protein
VILIRALAVAGDKQSIINAAEVKSETPDYNMANNRSEAVVAVKRPDCCKPGFQISSRARIGCDPRQGFYISR